MQLNNIQRLIEGLEMKDGEIKEKISASVAGDENAVLDGFIALSKLASSKGIELEQAVLRRIDELRKKSL